jgi:AcrR family transcriptional regulator
MRQSAAQHRQKQPLVTEEGIGVMEKGDDSRDKILRAAEQIFAEKGLAAASVRAITTAAGVNHALIGYYFGSKVALYEEVLERASTLISRPKLKRLAELKEEYGEAPIPLSDLIDAYIRSFFDDFGNPKSVPRTWLRFYGRVFSEQDDEVNRTTNRSVAHVRIAFLEELQRTLPDLSIKQLVYRLGAMIGTIAFWRGETGIMDDHFEDEELRHIDVDELVEEVISMCCAIFTSEPAKYDLMASKRKNQQATIQKSISSRNKTDKLSTPTTRSSRRHRKRVGTES